MSKITFKINNNNNNNVIKKWNLKAQKHWDMSISTRNQIFKHFLVIYFLNITNGDTSELWQCFIFIQAAFISYKIYI